MNIPEGIDKTLWNKADKIARASAPKNYIRIEINYDNEIVLPFEQGKLFLESLEYAETFTENYTSKATVIKEFDSDRFKIKLLSRSDYLKYKMNHLLGVNTDESV